LGISSSEIKEKAKKEMSTTIRYIYSDDSKKLLGNLASALKEKNLEKIEEVVDEINDFRGVNWFGYEPKEIGENPIVKKMAPETLMKMIKNAYNNNDSYRIYRILKCADKLLPEDVRKKFLKGVLPIARELLKGSITTGYPPYSTTSTVFHMAGGTIDEEKRMLRKYQKSTDPRRIKISSATSWEGLVAVEKADMQEAERILREVVRTGDEEKIEEAKNKAKKLSSFLGNKTINQIIEDERNKMKLESNGENKSENEENKFRGGEMTKGRIREKFRTGISRIKEGMEKGKRKVGGKLLQIKVGRIGKKVGTITKDVKFLEDEDKGGRSKDKKIENIHEMIKEIKSESDGGQKGEAGEEEIKEKDQEIERRKREIIDKLEEEYKKDEGYNPRGIHELKKELYSLIGKEEAEKIRKDLVDKYFWSKQKTEESEVAESPKEEENYGGQPTQPENIGNQPPRAQPIPGTQNFKIPKSGGLVSSVVKTNLKHMSISGGIGGIIGLIAYFVLHIPLIYSVIIVFVFMLLGIDLFRGGIFEAVFTPVIIGVVLTVALHWFINQFIPSIWEFTGLLFIAVLSISIIVILDVSQMK